MVSTWASLASVSARRPSRAFSSAARFSGVAGSPLNLARSSAARPMRACKMDLTWTSCSSESLRLSVSFRTCALSSLCSAAAPLWARFFFRAEVDWADAAVVADDLAVAGTFAAAVAGALVAVLVAATTGTPSANTAAAERAIKRTSDGLRAIDILDPFGVGLHPGLGHRVLRIKIDRNHEAVRALELEGLVADPHGLDRVRHHDEAIVAGGAPVLE